MAKQWHIYTRTGDKGETSLLGGVRVPKDDPRVEAYGAVDELNSAIGWALAVVKDSDIKEMLETVQQHLFTIGADISSPWIAAKTATGRQLPRTNKDMVDWLEDAVAKCEAGLVPLKHFILPNGCEAAAALHLARAAARKAERRAVTLARGDKLNPIVVQYLNRLSSLLFEAARLANKRAGVRETIWKA